MRSKFLQWSIKLLKEVELVDLLSKVSDVPMIQWVTFVLVSVYIILAIFVKAQRVHTENIRFFKSKNIEQALDKLVDGSNDKALFKELHAQSLFYANTGIDASLVQRKQIYEWTVKHGVPLSLVRMAWPSIHKCKDGLLKIKLNFAKKIFIAFNIVLISLLSMMSIDIFWPGLIKAFETGRTNLMVLSMLMALGAMIIYRFVRSDLYLSVIANAYELK